MSSLVSRRAQLGATDPKPWVASRPTWQLVLLAAITAFLVVAPVRPAMADVYRPETFTLDNGMRVVVVTNRRAPVVTHMVWYAVGAADEPPGKSGLAHLLEHLMFKGTETVPAGTFNAIVARSGGRDNAFTSWDFTAYFQTVARDQLETVMRLESDRMTNLVLDDEVFAPEQQVVLEERRERMENEPRDRLGEHVRALLFVRHPYGRPIIGWADEIEALSVEDTEQFYRRWYAPNNATLIVSGDVDVDDLRPLAEKHYGTIPARTLPDRHRPSEPLESGTRRVDLVGEEVRQPLLMRYYQAPSYARDPDGDVYAVRVLADLLGAGATSRLNRRLVVSDRLASGVGAFHLADSLDYGSFGMALTPIPGGSIADAEVALDDEIAHLLNDGVTAVEVETSKQRLIVEQEYALDSLSGPAFNLGFALMNGRSIDEIESWPERIGAVTVDAVMAAARRLFQEQPSVTGVLTADANASEG